MTNNDIVVKADIAHRTDLSAVDKLVYSVLSESLTYAQIAQALGISRRSVIRSVNQFRSIGLNLPAKFRTVRGYHQPKFSKLSKRSRTDDRFKMFDGKCWICREPAVEMDHVKPRAKSGSDLISNQRPICDRCNSIKRDAWRGIVRVTESHSAPGV